MEKNWRKKLGKIKKKTLKIGKIKKKIKEKEEEKI